MYLFSSLFTMYNQFRIVSAGQFPLYTTRRHTKSVWKTMVTIVRRVAGVVVMVTAWLQVSVLQ